MKNNKGVTLTSLIIYVIGMVIVVASISTLTTFFYKNIPFVSVKIVLLLDIDEIISDNVKSDFNYSIIDDSVKSDIGRTIRSQIAKVANYAKQNKVDIYELNNMFYKNNYYDYINYLQTGKTKEDIIENTSLTVDIEIRIV